MKINPFFLSISTICFVTNTVPIATITQLSPQYNIPLTKQEDLDSPEQIGIKFGQPLANELQKLNLLQTVNLENIKKTIDLAYAINDIIETSLPKNMQDAAISFADEKIGHHLVYDGVNGLIGKYYQAIRKASPEKTAHSVIDGPGSLDRLIAFLESTEPPKKFNETRKKIKMHIPELIFFNISIETMSKENEIIEQIVQAKTIAKIMEQATAFNNFIEEKINKGKMLLTPHWQDKLTQVTEAFIPRIDTTMSQQLEDIVEPKLQALKHRSIRNLQEFYQTLGVRNDADYQTFLNNLSTLPTLPLRFRELIADLKIMEESDAKRERRQPDLRSFILKKAAELASTIEQYKSMQTFQFALQEIDESIQDAYRELMTLHIRAVMGSPDSIPNWKGEVEPIVEYTIPLAQDIVPLEGLVEKQNIADGLYASLIRIKMALGQLSLHEKYKEVLGQDYEVWHQITMQLLAYITGMYRLFSGETGISFGVTPGIRGISMAERTVHRQHLKTSETLIKDLQKIAHQELPKIITFILALNGEKISFIDQEIKKELKNASAIYTLTSTFKDGATGWQAENTLERLLSALERSHRGGKFLRWGKKEPKGDAPPFTQIK